MEFLPVYDREVFAEQHDYAQQYSTSSIYHWIKPAFGEISLTAILALPSINFLYIGDYDSHKSQPCPTIYMYVIHSLIVHSAFLWCVLRTCKVICLLGLIDKGNVFDISMTIGDIIDFQQFVGSSTMMTFP